MFLHSPDNYHGRGGEHQKREGKKRQRETRGEGGGGGGKKPKGRGRDAQIPKAKVSLEDNAGINENTCGYVDL